jgi:hypothetical protein
LVWSLIRFFHEVSLMLGRACSVGRRQYSSSPNNGSSELRDNRAAASTSTGTAVLGVAGGAEGKDLDLGPIGAGCPVDLEHLSAARGVDKNASVHHEALLVRTEVRNRSPWKHRGEPGLAAYLLSVVAPARRQPRGADGEIAGLFAATEVRIRPVGRERYVAAIVRPAPADTQELRVRWSRKGLGNHLGLMR